MPRPKSTGLPAEEEESRRVDALLDVAAEVFFEDGFHGASTTKIAQRAHASKQSFYSRFPSKEKLFLAVIQRRMESGAETFGSFISEDAPIREVLLSMGKYFLDRLIDERHVALVRIVYMEATRFPEIAKAFMSSGPEQAVGRLEKYLARQTAEKRLAIEDTQMAAHDFVALISADLVQRALLGLPQRLTKAGLEKRAARGVDSFLKLYGLPTESAKGRSQ
ncbi:MAG: TetR/AcrR family transcriptional regulator [Acidobacteriaceae bacterium]|nr:TetR/AcrR family transcriptional regulator [Acidobacteriaceae bacterium]